MNSIDNSLEFKITTETNHSINVLDITIVRKSESIEINIYRKPTSSNIIHQNSDHPQDHKDAAYIYIYIYIYICYINRMTATEHKSRNNTREKTNN